MAIWGLVAALCAAYNENLVALTQSALSSGNGVIGIENADLSLFAGIREYYLVLLLTSTDVNHGCQICQTMPEVVGKVANSWYHDYLDSQMLFFAEIDLIDPRNGAIFLAAQIDTVPLIVLIAPNYGKVLPDSLQEQQLPANGFNILQEPRSLFALPKEDPAKQAIALAQFVSEALQKPIVIREDDPQMAFLKNFVLTLVVLMVIKKKGSQYILVSRKTAWMAVCVGLVVVFVGGYSFTTMNGIVFLAQNDKGGLIYFSGGQLYQFGIEIFLVAVNYVLLAASLVLLIYVGQYKVTETSKINSEATRLALVVLANGLVFLLYSFLTSAYLRKDGGYPYYFLRLF